MPIDALSRCHPVTTSLTWPSSKISCLGVSRRALGPPRRNPRLYLALLLCVSNKGTQDAYVFRLPGRGSPWNTSIPWVGDLGRESFGEAWTTVCWRLSLVRRRKRKKRFPQRVLNVLRYCGTLVDIAATLRLKRR